MSDYSNTDGASWSATIAAPLSSNANLASLSCSNATLSPAFSAGTTSYSATVPYSVSSLSLRYSAQDSGASVSVRGNSLSVGSNTVTLTVTAPSGSTKNYVIYVTRQQDPNYVASRDAALAALHTDRGTLSPPFDPEVLDYVIYLPYEADAVTLGGEARDSKALSVTGASAELQPGDNELTVVCLAEDGVSRGVYTVHVYRMPEFAGRLPEIIAPIHADYRAVDAALSKVPADLTGYTEETVKALRSAIDAVDRSCLPDQQDRVDAMARAIEDAIAALEEKPEPPALSPWQKLLEAAREKVDVPYVSDVTGPLSLKTVGIAAAVLAALLFYLIGTLVGRLVGKHRTLRRLEAELEDEEDDEADVPATTPDPPAQASPDEPEAPAEAPAEPESADPALPEPEIPAVKEATEADPEGKTPDEPLDSISLRHLLDDIENM